MGYFGLILSLVVVFVLGMMFMNIYNALVSLRNQIERAWSNIDVLLKQRFDEIPQLLQVIEQYAGYEKAMIDQVTQARQHYGQAKDIKSKIEASNEMQLALRGVFALGEAYPDLKANQNFLQLQTRVSGLESSLSDRREHYNEAVANFNTRIDQFPDVFAARFLNYQRQDLFQVTEQERQAPSLKMNIPGVKQSA